MTWSKGETITGGTNMAKVAFFMSEYMDGKGDPTSAKGGWRVGTGGLAGGDVCCLFSYLSADGVIRHSQFSLDVSSYSEGQVVNTRINQNYDPTETNYDNPNAFPFVPDSNSASQPEADVDYAQPGNMEIWYSSENPSAFLMIVNNRAIGSFFPITQMTTTPVPKSGGESNQPIEGYLDYVMMVPSFAGYTCYFVGPPISDVDGDVVIANYGPAFIGSPNIKQGETVVYKSVTVGDYGVQVARLADDVMLNIPLGQVWGNTLQLYTCYNVSSTTADNAVQPAFDGTNYYLYLGNQYGAGPNSLCWVLDLGSTPYSYTP